MKFAYLNRHQVKKMFPKRKKDAHKGDFGKILLLCGCKGYTGAAALAAMGALRVGAGLVYLGVPECIYAIEASKLTEAIVLSLPDEKGKLSCNAIEQIDTLLPQMDCVLVGPGLGQSDGTLAVVSHILKEYPGPVVLDADGINLLASHKDLLCGRTGVTILTPHEGEFKRLSDTLSRGREQAAADLANELGLIVLLKGMRSVITDGKKCYINLTGNPGMAVGGSGDVLAGMIAGLIGQHFEPLTATAVAAWLHGASGDLCAKKYGQYSMLPSDMLSVLPQLIK